MKKIIVIIILAVFIASIAIVNFFGLEIVETGEENYIKMIQCDSVTLKGYGFEQDLQPVGYVGEKNDIPKFEFEFKPSANGKPYTVEDSISQTSSNPNRILLTQNLILLDKNSEPLGPERYEELSFEYDDEAMAGIAVFDERSCSLIFLKPNSTFTVTIRCNNSNVFTTVKITSIQETVNN